VRQLVREHSTGHPASDAVAVASELATNSIVHSASGQPGGQFLVHLALAGDQQVAVIITDQGGPFRPTWTTPGPESESGRGLAVVRSLTSLFCVSEHASGHRTFLAVVTIRPSTKTRIRPVPSNAR
jgi:anti-sigma regulatory factor (Ser/Thr protein kinase)